MALLAMLATQARAQFVDCNTLLLIIKPVPSGTSCTLSTTHFETDTTSGSPSVVAMGNNPLQVQINQILSGPGAAGFLNVLNTLGVLGPLGPPTKQFLHTDVVIGDAVTVGPGLAFFGPGESLTVFVPAGSANVDQNTFTHDFFLLSASSQPLTQRGVNWLTGDLYTTVQTTLLDDGFRFVDMMLARGRDGSAQSISPALGFAAFAPDRAASPASDALAYMATKAPAGTAYVANGWSAWLTGAGASTKFDGTANNFGFGYSSGGAAGGMERRVGDWLYGGAFSVSRANVTQDSTGDSAGIDTQRFGAYVAFQPGPLSATAALAWGHHSADANRLTMLPSLGAQAGYQANSLDAGLEVSKTYRWNWGNFQPVAGFIYNGLWTNGFVENGNSLLGINSSSAEIASLKGYVGGRAYRTFVAPNGMDVTPEVRARVVYDFLNDPRGFNATFTADPTATSFAVSGLQPDRTSAILGTGVTVQFAKRWRGFLNYDAEVRGGSVAQIGSGGFGVNW